MKEFRGGMSKFFSADNQGPTETPREARTLGTDSQREDTQTGAREIPLVDEGAQRSHLHRGGNEDELAEIFLINLVSKGLEGPVDFFTDANLTARGTRGRGRETRSPKGRRDWGRWGSETTSPLAGSCFKFFFGQAGHVPELTCRGGDMAEFTRE